MSPKAKKIIQFVVLLAVGVLLVWLVGRQVAGKKDDIIKSFKSVNYFWVAMSAIVGLLGHVMRAYRWNYLLEPMGYRSKPLNANAAVFIGYLFNYGIPRSGELSRCTIVAKYDGIPFEKALGTVITERIIDFLLLLLVFGLTLLFQFKELVGLVDQYIWSKLQPKLHIFIEKPVYAVIVMALMIIFFGGLFYFRKKIKGMLTGKFGNIIKGFGGGLSSVKETKNKGMFSVLSVGIWLTYLLGLYFTFFAFQETAHLGLSEGLVLLLFGTFGVIFTPGGLGAYHAIITGVLIYYKIDAITAFAFPWVVWGTQLLAIAVVGILSLIVLPIYNKEKDVAK